MAINLKPVDVAVIGLGAAGGVALLPLARAGLKVAGLEAGTWMDPRTFRPDELHNNVRGFLTSVPKANREVPSVRDGPSSPARRLQRRYEALWPDGDSSAVDRGRLAHQL
jgi:choline dehydrogenase-like flavoprotein